MEVYVILWVICAAGIVLYMILMYATRHTKDEHGNPINSNISSTLNVRKEEREENKSNDEPLLEDNFPVYVTYHEYHNIVSLSIDFDSSKISGGRVQGIKILNTNSFVNAGDDIIKIQILDKDSKVLSYSILKSKYTGIYVEIEKRGSSFDRRFAKIYKTIGEPIAEDFDKIINKLEERHSQICQEREKEREIEEEKEKILERQRKRNLKKLAQQQLRNEGLLFPEANRRPSIPKEVVDAVWNRDGGCCVYCKSNENIHIDHIIPFSKGGSSGIENLQLLCQKCNLEKSNKIG